MQCFLCKENSTFTPNEFITVTFDGSDLRTYFKGKLIDNRIASAGECYNIFPRGQDSPPIVEKANMPESRGKKIAWALSFVEESKHAESFDDFYNRFNQIADSYLHSPSQVCRMKKGVYGFLLAQKPIQFGKGRKAKEPKMKPLFVWISDEISQNDLDDLIQTFQQYRKIYCPIEFLKVL